MTTSPDKSVDKATLISSEDKARIDMLLIQVKSLAPADQEDVMKHQLKTLQESFLAACTVDNVLSYAIESFMDSCLESCSLCEKVGIVFQALSDVFIGQVKVRSVILTCLQKNFSNLKHLQDTNNKQWLNSIALFVAIFHHVRYANGKHLIMLASFVIQALLPLLSGDEAEMRLLAKSVISNGQILREGASQELDQLLIDIRTTVIKRNLSSECRLWLLLSADVAEVNFGQLRKPILDFYKEHLGDSVVAILETGAKNKPVVITDTATEDAVVKSTGSPTPKISGTGSPTPKISGTGSPTPKSTGSPTPKSTGSPTHKSTASPKSPSTGSPKSPSTDSAPRKERVDRRLTESHAFPRSKDDLSDKVQGIRINHSEKSQRFAGAIGYESKGKGHWGHDDRFSNDEYEPPRPRPDRFREKKTPDSPEKSDSTDRPERTKVPEGNWRLPQSPSKDYKERAVQSAPKIAAPPCEEVWE